MHELHCNFCGKPQAEVPFLVETPDHSAAICGVCAFTVLKTIEQHVEAKAAAEPSA